MLKTILGSKVGMGAVYVKNNRVPVTYVKTGPCVVTAIKETEKHGYLAVQLGFLNRKVKNITKPLAGQLAAVIKDQKAPRFIREVRLATKDDLKVGDIVSLKDIFKKGDVVAVTGISKGKGFAGVVKRWHFKGGPKTHGQSDRERHPGSIGQTTTPGRVLKGKKMAGRMGSEQKTVKNLHIVAVDEDQHQIAVSGPVPGHNGSLLTITKTKSGSLDELIEETPVVVAQAPVESEAPVGEDKPVEN